MCVRKLLATWVTLRSICVFIPARDHIHVTYARELLVSWVIWRSIHDFTPVNVHMCVMFVKNHFMRVLIWTDIGEYILENVHICAMFARSLSNNEVIWLDTCVYIPASGLILVKFVNDPLPYCITCGIIIVPMLRKIRNENVIRKIIHLWSRGAWSTMFDHVFVLSENDFKNDPKSLFMCGLFNDTLSSLSCFVLMFLWRQINSLHMKPPVVDSLFFTSRQHATRCITVFLFSFFFFVLKCNLNLL